MDDFEWTRPGMAVMTAADLQAARKAAAERFTAIAMSYVPEGYTVEYRKSLSGRHYGKRKLIQAPRPVTRKALYIFLHECAHAHLHRDRMPKAHVRVLRGVASFAPHAFAAGTLFLAADCVLAQQHILILRTRPIARVSLKQV
jgi:hypothetical protein